MFFYPYIKFSVFHCCIFRNDISPDGEEVPGTIHTVTDNNFISPVSEEVSGTNHTVTDHDIHSASTRRADETNSFLTSEVKTSANYWVREGFVCFKDESA